MFVFDCELIINCQSLVLMITPTYDTCTAAVPPHDNGQRVDGKAVAPHCFEEVGGGTPCIMFPDGVGQTTLNNAFSVTNSICLAQC